MSYKYSIRNTIDDEKKSRLAEELSITPEEFDRKSMAKICDGEGFSENELRIISSVLGCSAFELFTKDAVEYFYDKKRQEKFT